jgi:hypothetical protein
MATSLQFALANPTPGMEEEFNRWYSSEHTDHVIRIPGILAGQRFQRAPGPWPSGKHDYVMIWEMDDPKFALEQLGKARGGEDMPLSPSIDMATVQPPTLWIRASVRNRDRVVTDSASRKTIVMGLVNAVKDEAPAFAENMVRGGVADLADLPGVIAADFLTLADEQIRGSARKYAYGLLIELADEKTGLASLTGPLASLPHCDYTNWIATVFRPMNKRITAVEAARAR